MRSFEDKRMGRPAAVEDFSPADQKKFDDKISLQLMAYRSRNPDPDLMKLGKKLVEDIFPEDFNATQMMIEHEICIAYLNNPASGMGYWRLPPIRHDTGRDKAQWYSIPELPIEKCQGVLRKFGLIE